MTVEEYIQNTLQSISGLNNYLSSDAIYPFTSPINAKLNFVRWTITSEEKAVELLTAKDNTLYKVDVLISIFAKTAFIARKIADSISDSFNNDNINNDNIQCSRADTLSPIVEDKETVHYPMTLTIYYTKQKGK